jgi:Nucleotidyl transferase AbiEii toxin, Type IV TA system
VPLDPLQERIARTALALPEARTLALAGGGAMIAHGFVTRQTKDIDLFTEIDDSEAVRVAAALRRALEEQVLATRDGDRPPFEHRFVGRPATGSGRSEWPPTRLYWRACQGEFTCPGRRR